MRGYGLPTGEPVEWWIADGILRGEPIPGARTVFGGDGHHGWIIPGLVDAHCHVGLGPGGAVDIDEAVVQAQTERDAGALLLRDCGSPTDTRPLADHHDLPEIIRAGRHLARPKRYSRGYATELEDEWQLPEVVAEQARWGDGWVKIVGDWIDREVGDLAPLWPDDVLARAVAVAHAAGCRVTTHVFGEDALPGLLAAGVDCIEHGTGLTDETIAAAAAQGTHLVPTLINIENFPSFADQATRFPTYARHMRDLYARNHEMVRDAVDAGVAVHAGTDAGGFIEHGRIADEVIALGRLLGMRRALAASAHEARAWMGVPGTQVGAPADLVIFADDPVADPSVLRRPAVIVRSGRVVRGVVG